MAEVVDQLAILCAQSSCRLDVAKAMPAKSFFEACLHGAKTTDHDHEGNQEAGASYFDVTGSCASRAVGR